MNIHTNLASRPMEYGDSNPNPNPNPNPHCFQRRWDVKLAALANVPQLWVSAKEESMTKVEKREIKGLVK